MDINKPLISVVMSVYKEPLDWLHQSIDSILNQTFSDFEFIIVCDNPNYEDGKALLKDYAEKDSRVKLIFNDENIGLTKSLNKGLSIAQGEYIARMDADDISLPQRFEVEVNYLRSHPYVDVCGSNKKAFGNVTFFTRKLNRNIPCSNDEVKASLFFVNSIVHPSVMMKRVIGGKVVSYDENYRVAQDYMFWHDLLKDGAVINVINEVLILYRISGTQISSKNDAQRKVCDAIHKELLKELKPDITEEELVIHSEVMSTTKSDISLKTKLDYLAKLSILLMSQYDSPKYIEYLVSYYALKNCITYQRPFYYLKPYTGIKRVFGKTCYWRMLAKYYYMKIRRH